MLSNKFTRLSHNILLSDLYALCSVSFWAVAPLRDVVGESYEKIENLGDKIVFENIT